jgi:DNA-binding transcriptional ArsR family regulator
LLPTGNAAAGAPPERSARLFAALGDETRLRLVSRLCEEGPLSVTALTGGFPVTRQAITKHLRVLEEAGLARSLRHGRESVWQLSPEGLDDARRYLELISQRWDHALDRLRRFVEE